MASVDLSRLKFDSDGLIPAIVQDADNDQVLMMAWMNAEAVRKTVDTGLTHFFSRSRQKVAACHTGHRSCFYRTLDGNEVSEAVFDAGEVYGDKGKS